MRRSESQEKAYDATLALHALTAFLDNGDASDPAHLLRLIRTLRQRVESLKPGTPVPSRPRRVDTASEPPCGFGALLSELLEPGSGRLSADLVRALADDKVVAEVYAIEERFEELYGDERPSQALPPPPNGPAAHHVPIVAAGGWTAMAAVEASYTTGDPAAVPPAGTASSGSRVWSPLSEAFLLAADEALAGARGLLARLGRPQPARVGAVFDTTGILAPSTVPDGLGAGTIALTYIARQAGLGTPAELDVLVLAQVSKDGLCTPVTDHTGAADLARSAGLRVLRCVTGGWEIEGAAGGPGSKSRDASLAGAAQLLWDEEWTEAKDSWSASALKSHNWRVLRVAGKGAQQISASGTPWGVPVEGVQWVEAPQVDALASQLLLQPHLSIVLGGQPGSGKTVIAGKLTQRLINARWQILVLRPDDNCLPAEGDLSVIVGSALNLSRLVPNDKTLVIIEDLHPLGGGSLAALSDLASVLGVSVLGLLRFSEGLVEEWDTPSISAIEAVVSPDDVADLARKMAAEFPKLYEVPDDLIEPLVDLANRDLWLLSRLMSDIARNKRAGTFATISETLVHLITARLAGLEGFEQDRDQVRLVAALSMLGQPTPEGHLSATALKTLASLGAHPLFGLVRLPSRELARLVFDRTSADGQADDHEVQAVPVILPHLARLLRERRSGLAVDLLKRLRVYDLNALDKSGGDQVWEEIVRWSAAAAPPTVAAALSHLDSFASDFRISDLLPDLMRRTATVRDLDAPRLSSVVELLQKHRLALQDTEAMRSFVEWLADPETGLGAVLRRPARIGERYNAVLRLFRLHEPEMPAIIIAQAPVLVQGIDKTSAVDLVQVRRLDILLARCYRVVERGDGWKPGERVNEQLPLEHFPEVYDLRDHRPPSGSGLGALLAQLSLRLHFDPRIDWDELIQGNEGLLRSAFTRATAPEISMVLGDLSANHRGFCTKLMHRLAVSGAMRSLIRTAAPADAANLIATVGRIHKDTANKMLHEDRAEDLARVLATRIIKLKDGKGAGLLLSRTHEADELFCSSGPRFASLLAEELGEEFAVRLVSKERRPSILYYFLKGIWQADASYRKVVEDDAFNLIVRSLGSAYRVNRPWAAQLAVLLAADDYLGEEFLQRISEAVPPKILARQMTQPRLRVDAALHMHRLGRAISPDLPRLYAEVQGRDELWRRPRRLERASDVAQRLSVISTTLRMSDPGWSNAQILQRFKQNAPDWDWGEEISKVRTTSDLTASLNSLQKLDPGTASAALETLKAVPEGRSYSALEDVAVRSASRPPDLAELLHCVERIEKEQGRKLLSHIRQKRHFWTAFTEEIRYMQDPVTQGRVGRHLADLGVTPQTGDSEWIKKLLNGRWLGLVGQLASPRALCGLLRLSYIWDEQWGHQLAANANQGAVLARIKKGAAEDLREVPRLLEILTRCGQNDLAQAVMDQMTQFPKDELARSLGLHRATELLRRYREDRPADVQLFGPAVGRAVERASRRHLVLDHGAHWASIGWAAQTLGECGLGDALPDAVPILPVNAAFAAEICWAATWMPESEWTRAQVAELLDIAVRQDRSSTTGSRLAYALVAGARAGRTAAFFEDTAHWSQVTEAPLGTLCLAYREASGHAALGVLTRSLKPALHKRLKSPVHRIDPWRAELLQLLGPAQRFPGAPSPSALFRAKPGPDQGPPSP
ncbi:hypothetical protein [Actinocorallia longicatena]|uniref:AAA+ ATPase domain-containing protein n=1 Tax=Actinocorallia longicatena TaxID=111803 RepID=A0ABP6QGY0_9ACTN